MENAYVMTGDLAVDKEGNYHIFSYVLKSEKDLTKPETQ
jgi:hypothetical protein